MQFAIRYSSRLINVIVRRPAVTPDCRTDELLIKSSSDLHIMIMASFSLFSKHIVICKDLRSNVILDHIEPEL